MSTDTKTLSGRLGDHFKVSRATVTRDRDFFVMTKNQAREKGLTEFALPVITSSREFSKTDVVRDGPDRHVVIAIPATIDRKAHPQVDAWLRSHENAGSSSQRTAAWWAFGIKRPAAAATYKGENGPRLVANPDRMVLLNVAYGLEPLTEMKADEVEEFVRRFNSKTRPSGMRQALSMSTAEVASAII